MLNIAVSSRTLFHVEDGNEIFKKEGQAAFDAYMDERKNIPLRPGAAFHLVRKLLALNTHEAMSAGSVRVILLSRNSPYAGLRVMNSVEHYGLDIESAIFCRGDNRFRCAKVLKPHLFLSANAPDVQAALQAGIAAATILPVEREEEANDEEIRIAFDGDAVLFSDEADVTYRRGGLAAFRQSESEKADIPLGDGPFRFFLEALHTLQKQFKPGTCPLRVALVTARGLPSHARVMNTLQHWGVHVDDAIFAGGMPKGPLLEAFGVDVFFDDTQKNIDSAVSCNITSGHVPYGTGEGIVVELAA